MWDFQGASGFATIVPAVTGVFLASWAIYTQITQNSSFYRLAENYMAKLIELRYKSASAILLVLPLVDELRRRDIIADFDQNFDSSFENLISEGDSLNINKGVDRDAARGVLRYLKSQFDLSVGFEQGRPTIAGLFVDVAPILLTFLLHGKKGGFCANSSVCVEPEKIIDDIFYDINLMSHPDFDSTGLDVENLLLSSSIRLFDLANLFLSRFGDEEGLVKFMTESKELNEELDKVVKGEMILRSKKHDFSSIKAR